MFGGYVASSEYDIITAGIKVVAELSFGLNTSRIELQSKFWIDNSGV